MKRREFIGFLFGAGLVWPRNVGAQQSSHPVIGFLNSQSSETFAHLRAAFLEGLREGGHVEGQNVEVEYRWADGHYDRMPALAAELVRRKVAIIFAGGGEPVASAAEAATTTIPIVAILDVAAAVARGRVASIRRPGGNMTGVGLIASALEQKRLELLHQLLPSVTTISVLVNPGFPGTKDRLQELADAAGILRLQLRILNAASDAEIDAAFATMWQEGIKALLIGTDPFLFNRRLQIVALAARYGIAANYTQREYATAGGLMSYGTNLAAAYRRAGIYTARILNGENPAELPIVQDAVFELVINMKTAKALGLTVPVDLTVAATELIE